jgi:hypothetical protein
MEQTSKNGATATVSETASEVSVLQKKFRSQGWNVAGANMLALSCWQAKSVYLYFR